MLQNDPLASALSNILQGFSPGQPCAWGVAYSGGADSLALALAARRCSPNVPIAIVDHGIRPESSAEAQAMAAQFAPPIFVLRDHSGPAIGATALEEQARRMRYQLLAAWARELGLQAIAIAHHQDDQIETCIMRWRRNHSSDADPQCASKRAAGLGRETPPPLDGLNLAGLRPISPLPLWPEGRGIWLLRPFLPFTKAQLRADLDVRAREGQPLQWAEDPMNADPRFERAALRATIAGLEPCARAEYLNRWRDLALASQSLWDRISEEISAILAQVEFLPGSEIRLARTLYRDLAPEARSLLASVLIGAASGRERAPVRERARQVFDDLCAEGRTEPSRARTLNTCRISVRSDRITCQRAPWRRGEAQACQRALAPFESLIWDGRFLISAKARPIMIQATGGKSARLCVTPRVELAGPVPCRAEASAADNESPDYEIECLTQERAFALLGRRLPPKHEGLGDSSEPVSDHPVPKTLNHCSEI